MKFKRISKPALFVGFLGLTLIFTVILLGRKQPPPPPTPQIDFQQAVTVSDAVVKDLEKDDAKDLLSRLDLGFHLMVKGEDDMRRAMEKMKGLYGKPLECTLKASQAGTRVDGEWKRPSRTFFYTVKTTKYPVGKYFLKIEVVPGFSRAFLDLSGFGYISFKDGAVPDYLK